MWWEGVGWGRGTYAASQTIVLHMKRLDQTESPIFVIVCVLCFQRQSCLTFIACYESVSISNTFPGQYEHAFNHYDM